MRTRFIIVTMTAIGVGAMPCARAGGEAASNAQVSGAQFSAARFGTGQSQPASGGATLSGATLSQPAQNTVPPPAIRSSVPRGTSTFGTGGAPSAGTSHRLYGYGAAPVAGGVPSGVSIIRPPVAITSAPLPQPVASQTINRNSAAKSSAVTPSAVNTASAAGATPARTLTRAAQWRHGTGHAHHHRHFVFLNNIIYLVDGGVYDSADFYYGPETSSYAYEDGYYDTFDASVVLAVQTRLGNEGYYNGAIDSKITPGLRTAIARYQQDHGLQPTGQIDEALLNELALL